MARPPNRRGVAKTAHRLPQVTYVTCVCGKRGFHDRKSAKTMMKALHPEAHLSVYQCTRANLFHYGNLPQPVVNGTMDRAELGPAKIREPRYVYNSGKPAA